jgi:hypothetical protein
MKKVILILGAVLFASALIVGDLYAYNYSHDTSYMRTMARAATIDAPDAVYYNAVGLVKMADGMYLDLGNQMGAKRYEHKFLAANYHDASPAYIMPNFALVWKKDKAAIFVEMHIPAGGGTVMYRNIWGIGVLSSESALAALPLLPSKVKGSSSWIQGSAGGSYAFTEWLAVTGCVKYSQYSYEQAIGYVGLGTISKTKTSAGGFSGAGGIMITPEKSINVTVLYSTEVIARGKTTEVKYHYSHIDEARLPDYLLIGINFKPTDAVSIQASYQLNFSQQKNFGTTRLYDLATGYAITNFVYSHIDPTTGLSVVGGNIQDYKGRLSHKAGLGGEFLVHKMLMIGLGVSYESQDVYPRVNNPFDPSLKNIGVGVGLKIIPIEQFSIQLSAAKYSYFTDHRSFGLVKMNKSVWSFGIGLTGKII